MEWVRDHKHRDSFTHTPCVIHFVENWQHNLKRNLFTCNSCCSIPLAFPRYKNAWLSLTVVTAQSHIDIFKLLFLWAQLFYLLLILLMVQVLTTIKNIKHETHNITLVNRLLHSNASCKFSSMCCHFWWHKHTWEGEVLQRKPTESTKGKHLNSIKICMKIFIWFNDAFKKNPDWHRAEIKKKYGIKKKALKNHRIWSMKTWE